VAFEIFLLDMPRVDGFLHAVRVPIQVLQVAMHTVEIVPNGPNVELQALVVDGIESDQRRVSFVLSFLLSG
jgi:hypothetical protein